MDALNTASLIAGIVGFPLGVVGLVLTIYYARKAERTEAELKRISGLRKRLDWSEIQTAAGDLKEVMSAAGVVPTIIITPGLAGATFANLFEDALAIRTPVYVGIRHWKTGGTEEVASEHLNENYITVETTKWVVSIPRIPVRADNSQILILDDFVMSGDFLAKFKTALVESGVPVNRIHSAAIVTTQVALHSKKGPDFWWLVTDDDNFYFPWGKAR